MWGSVVRRREGETRGSGTHVVRHLKRIEEYLVRKEASRQWTDRRDSFSAYGVDGTNAEIKGLGQETRGSLPDPPFLLRPR